MKYISQSDQKLLVGISLTSVAIPVLVWLLWIYCFYSHDNHADRLEMFFAFFPKFLQGRYTIPVFQILLCMVGIIMVPVYWFNKNFWLRVSSVLVAIVGGVTVLLTLFTLL